jgi:parallel beta-helix repeat protein
MFTILILLSFSLTMVNIIRIDIQLIKETPKNELFLIHTSWDGGNGTIGNPYILENKTFDGGSTNGYSLINFDRYFIIRNCTFINSGTADDNAGLRLVGVENGLIYNNTFESCWNGILFSQQIGTCQNNLVMNNTFRNNINGIRVAYLAQQINITENRFYNNVDGIEFFSRGSNSVLYNYFESNNAGIHLLGSDSNKIIGNQVRYTTNFGIYLENSDTNEIRGNIVKYSDVGVLLDYSKSNEISLNIIASNTEAITFQTISEYNTIYNNTISNNDKGIHIFGDDSNYIIGNEVRYNNNFGINLENSDSNEVIGNVVKNSAVGVLLDMGRYNNIYLNSIYSNTVGITFQTHSDDNAIYNNTFCANNDHISLTSSSGNTFHNDSIGNYWDDYDGYDCNGDGIGETSYDEGSISDPLPICHRPDIYDPIVSIINLIDGQVFNTTTISFILSIQEYQVDKIYYQIDLGTNYSCGSSGTIDQILWDSLPNGRHNITFYVLDLAKNVGVTEVYIFKDTTEEPKNTPEGPSIPFSPYFSLIMIVAIVVILMYSRRKISVYV